MLSFIGLDLLLKEILGKEINEWVYANISQVDLDPLKAEYYIFPQEEIWELENNQVYEDENGSTLPIEYKDKNLCEWLEVAIIEDAIEVLKSNTKNPNISQIAKALQYYYENDAFMR